MRVFYERLKKSKGHRQAVVATARKLATIIYHLLTNQEMYEYDLMLKPKTIKMPVHKGSIRNNRINFGDTFVDMIQPAFGSR